MATAWREEDEELLRQYREEGSARTGESARVDAALIAQYRQGAAEESPAPEDEPADVDEALIAQYQAGGAAEDLEDAEAGLGGKRAGRMERLSRELGEWEKMGVPGAGAAQGAVDAVRATGRAVGGAADKAILGPARWVGRQALKGLEMLGRVATGVTEMAADTVERQKAVGSHMREKMLHGEEYAREEPAGRVPGRFEGMREAWSGEVGFADAGRHLLRELGLEGAGGAVALGVLGKDGATAKTGEQADWDRAAKPLMEQWVAEHREEMGDIGSAEFDRRWRSQMLADVGEALGERRPEASDAEMTAAKSAQRDAWVEGGEMGLGMALTAVLDPVNYTGVGVVSKMGVAAKGARAVEHALRLGKPVDMGRKGSAAAVEMLEGVRVAFGATESDALATMKAALALEGKELNAGRVAKIAETVKRKVDDPRFALEQMARHRASLRFAGMEWEGAGLQRALGRAKAGLGKVPGAQTVAERFQQLFIPPRDLKPGSGDGLLRMREEFLEWGTERAARLATDLHGGVRVLSKRLRAEAEARLPADMAPSLRRQALRKIEEDYSEARISSQVTLVAESPALGVHLEGFGPGEEGAALSAIYRNLLDQTLLDEHMYGVNTAALGSGKEKAIEDLLVKLDLQAGRKKSKRLRGSERRLAEVRNANARLAREIVRMSDEARAIEMGSAQEMQQALANAAVGEMRAEVRAMEREMLRVQEWSARLVRGIRLESVRAAKAGKKAEALRLREMARTQEIEIRRAWAQDVKILERLEKANAPTPMGGRGRWDLPVDAKLSPAAVVVPPAGGWKTEREAKLAAEVLQRKWRRSGALYMGQTLRGEKQFAGLRPEMLEGGGGWGLEVTPPPVPVEETGIPIRQFIRQIGGLSNRIPQGLGRLTTPRGRRGRLVTLTGQEHGDTWKALAGEGGLVGSEIRSLLAKKGERGVSFDELPDIIRQHFGKAIQEEVDSGIPVSPADVVVRMIRDNSAVGANPGKFAHMEDAYHNESKMYSQSERIMRGEVTVEAPRLYGVLRGMHAELQRLQARMGGVEAKRARAKAADTGVELAGEAGTREVLGIDAAGDLVLGEERADVAKRVGGVEARAGRETEGILRRMEESRRRVQERLTEIASGRYPVGRYQKRAQARLRALDEMIRLREAEVAAVQDLPLERFYTPKMQEQLERARELQKSVAYDPEYVLHALSEEGRKYFIERAGPGVASGPRADINPEHASQIARTLMNPDGTLMTLSEANRYYRLPVWRGVYMDRDSTGQVIASSVREGTFRGTRQDAERHFAEVWKNFDKQGNVIGGKPKRSPYSPPGRGRYPGQVEIRLHAEGAKADVFQTSASETYFERARRGVAAASSLELLRAASARYGRLAQDAPGDWVALKDERLRRAVARTVEETLQNGTKRERQVDLFFPKEVADALERRTVLQRMDEASEGIAQAALYLEGLWKRSALAAVGYHSRNAVSNIFNNMLAGVYPLSGLRNCPYKKASAVQAARWEKMGLSPSAMPLQDAAKAEGAVFVRGLGGVDYTLEEVVDYAERHGVVSQGQTAVEIGGALKQRTARTSANPLNLEFGAWRANRALGTAVEDNARLAHFIRKLEAGESPADAALSVKKYLFDYKELTDFERRVLKRFLPFYTWSRKNIPLQVSGALERPWVSMQTHRLPMALGLGETPAEGEAPGWMQPGTASFLGTDRDEVFTLEGYLPMFDIAKAKPSRWLETVLENLNPYGFGGELWKQAWDYDPYFGKSITGKRESAKPGGGAGIEGMEGYSMVREQALGVGMSKRGAHAVRSLRVLNDLDKIFGLRRKGEPMRERVAAWMTGLRFYPVATQEEIRRQIEAAAKAKQDALALAGRLKRTARKLERQGAAHWQGVLWSAEDLEERVRAGEMDTKIKEAKARARRLQETRRKRRRGEETQIPAGL